MREHGHELLRPAAPSLLGGGPADLLGELGAVRHEADPAGHRLGHARVPRSEEVRLQGRGEQHAAPLPSDVERHAEVRADPEPFLEPLQLFGILLDVAVQKKLSGPEHLHRPTAVGDLQDVQAELPLQRGEPLVARAVRHQRIARSVVEESVDLVRPGRRRDEVAGVDQGRPEVPAGNAQQALENLEHALREAGVGGVQSGDAAKSMPKPLFFQGRIAALAAAMKNMSTEGVSAYC